MSQSHSRLFMMLIENKKIIWIVSTSQTCACSYMQFGVLVYALLDNYTSLSQTWPHREGTEIFMFCFFKAFMSSVESRGVRRWIFVKSNYVLYCRGSEVNSAVSSSPCPQFTSDRVSVSTPCAPCTSCTPLPHLLIRFPFLLPAIRHRRCLVPPLGCSADAGWRHSGLILLLLMLMLKEAIGTCYFCCYPSPWGQPRGINRQSY